jgi:hypothetical protein
LASTTTSVRRRAARPGRAAACRRRPPACCLLVEVAALDHAPHARRRGELHLTPPPARLRLAQGIDERPGLPAELLGGQPHAADLLAQLAERAGPLLLQPGEVGLDQRELLAQRPDQVLDRPPLPVSSRSASSRVPASAWWQALEGGEQRRLITPGEQPPGEQAGAQPDQQADASRAGGPCARPCHGGPTRTGTARGPVASYDVSLSIGIVGLPNVGKSTLFNALTEERRAGGQLPFATIEPNVGVVGVPDERIAKLAEVFGSQKTIPRPVDFVDIAGIVKGASEARGWATSSSRTSATATRSARSSASSRTTTSCTSTGGSRRRTTWRPSTPS